ncbi:enoyl-CoA hydratase-related protein [Candidatus Chlorohelix sp.]|uniref:enoyl-CoA hydratase/isomerase family protein n=1 Tax=Candidatus Chlorohelix sp. TaxID=3139201 RepID=UPI00302E20D2
MEYRNVLLQIEGARADIIINRPERRNALNSATISELVAAFEECRDNQAVRVVVLSGAGDKAFCAGADLAETQQSMSEYIRWKGREPFIYLWELLGKLGKPIIAQVQGAALAGGMGLAVNCDFVIAGEQARFGTPEINVGMFPMMISAILIRNLGRKKAIDLMLTGRQIDAHEAERIGVATRVVAQEQLKQEVDALATELAAKSPAIMKLGKDALYNASDLPFEQSLDYLSSMLSLCILTEDSREGLTAFLEKRKPIWKGQ